MGVAARGNTGGYNLRRRATPYYSSQCRAQGAATVLESDWEPEPESESEPEPEPELEPEPESELELDPEREL